MEMNKYKVRIIETLDTVIEVLAESQEEAISTVEKDYNNEKYILDYNNYISTDFKLVKDKNMK